MHWEVILTRYRDSRKLLRFTPAHGSNWGQKIAHFVFWAFIAFIIAFRGFEIIGRS